MSLGILERVFNPGLPRPATGVLPPFSDPAAGRGRTGEQGHGADGQGNIPVGLGMPHPAEDRADDCARLIFIQRPVTDQQTIHHGAKYQVENEVAIHAGVNFAALDAPLPDDFQILPAGLQEAFAEKLAQFRIALPLRDKMAQQPAAGVFVEINGRLELDGKIVLGGPGIWYGHRLLHAGEEGIQGDNILVGPPFVQGGFAHAGIAGDLLSRDIPQGTLGQQFHGGLQNGRFRLRAALAAPAFGRGWRRHLGFGG